MLNNDYGYKEAERIQPRGNMELSIPTQAIFSRLLSSDLDEHLHIDLAREVDASAVDDDCELRQILEAAQPVPNAIGYLGLEPSHVLQIANLRLYLDAVGDERKEGGQWEHAAEQDYVPELLDELFVEKQDVWRV